MSLCERTLREWLDERVEPVSQPLVTVILTQILSGLDYIHSRGVVHHDIKVLSDEYNRLIVKSIKSLNYLNLFSFPFSSQATFLYQRPII